MKLDLTDEEKSLVDCWCGWVLEVILMCHCSVLLTILHCECSTHVLSTVFVCFWFIFFSCWLVCEVLVWLTLTNRVYLDAVGSQNPQMVSSGVCYKQFGVWCYFDNPLLDSLLYPPFSRTWKIFSKSTVAQTKSGSREQNHAPFRGELSSL